MSKAFLWKDRRGKFKILISDDVEEDRQEVENDELKTLGWNLLHVQQMEGKVQQSIICVGQKDGTNKLALIDVRNLLGSADVARGLAELERLTGLADARKLIEHKGEIIAAMKADLNTEFPLPCTCDAYGRSTGCLAHPKKRVSCTCDARGGPECPVPGHTQR